MALIMQEVSQERYIEIPEPVREIYKLYRPSPLVRARRLEKALDTPARIYYKYRASARRSLNRTQLLLRRTTKRRVKKLATETGPVSGVAPGPGRNSSDIELVFMVKVSYYRSLSSLHQWKSMGESASSPTNLTNVNAASWRRTQTRRTTWALPSARLSRWRRPVGRHQVLPGRCLNHVLLHQTIVGEEALSVPGRWAIILMW
jgi:tryptophan synthase beta chain